MLAAIMHTLHGGVITVDTADGGYHKFKIPELYIPPLFNRETLLLLNEYLRLKVEKHEQIQTI